MRPAAGGLIGRVSAYGALPLISAVTPFIALPVVAHRTSVSEWAAIGLGQSLGTLAALVISYGWTQTGPSRILALTGPERAQVYAESVRTRLVALGAILPVLLAVTIELSPSGTALLAVSMALAMAVTGLSCAWFNVGEGRPADVARYDALPRAGSAIAAAVLVGRGGPLIGFPLLLLAASAVGYFLFAERQRRRRTDLGVGVPLRLALRNGFSPAVSVAISGAYAVMSVSVVAVVASSHELAAFSSANRVYVLTGIAVTVVAQVAQPWARPDRAPTPRESATTRVLYALAGVLGLVVLTVAGPTLGRLLFGEALTFSELTGLLFGIAFVLLTWSTYLTRQVLVPRGRNGSVLAASLLGVLAGVPLFLTFGRVAGADGAAAALVVGQFLVCAWEWAATRRLPVLHASHSDLARHNG